MSEEREYRILGRDGQKEIRFKGAFESGCKLLVSFFENSIKSGKRFSANQTIQLGYSLLQIRETEDGNLRVYEPDFQSMPMEYVDSVSRSTFLMMQQKYVSESFDRQLQLTIPSLESSGIVCNSFEMSNELVLSRNEVHGNDSGWFVGCANDKHDHNNPDNLARMSLYEIGLRKPEVVSFFGLPTSCLVVLKSGNPIRSFDGNGVLMIKPDSFLAAKIAAVRE